MTQDKSQPRFDRVVLIVLDGVGCGELPDASEYGDVGASTLAHISQHYPELNLPNLAAWGLGNLTDMPTTPPVAIEHCLASFGRCLERSIGKDTTSGHWEMSGVVVDRPFATFPNGFPAQAVEQWLRACELPGVLGNCAGSGTEIMRRFGDEHLRTGKPILYTSADSVWQVAAHEERFGLERLYAICKQARAIADELAISRVIARPFVGDSTTSFRRTHHRKDFSQTPFRRTAMEAVSEAGLLTLGIGKIWNIFNGRGLDRSLETADNSDGLRTLVQALQAYRSGLIFINLVDFDMIYGHRRDVPGFAQALMEFDAFLPFLQLELGDRDLAMITADHGIDPTFRGTDHTREYAPLLVYHQGSAAHALGTRESLADIGQSVVHALTGKTHDLEAGTSFLEQAGLLD